ncbi:MAG: glycosyltransferase family 2 protein [Flavobacteriales bacterium]|nr:glycosyltransferase family 2 protein [Flavobacteriales bacterium]
MDLSIITINFNTSQITLNCINSIISTMDRELSYEIIVTDNNSELEDYQFLKENFPKQENIHLYRSSVNTGFGGGNMFGVNFAKGDYYVFVNSDCVVKEPIFKHLLDFYKSTPNAGMIGPKVIHESNKHNYSFSYIYNLKLQLFGRHNYIKRYGLPDYRADYNSPVEVDYVIGSFMFLKRSIFEEIGGFDTNIFLYYEETDLGIKLHKKGYKNYYVPSVSYTHIGSVSVKENILKKNLRMEMENQISQNYIFKKHNSFFSILIYIILKTIKLTRSALLEDKNYWKLLKLHLQGSPLYKSMKVDQKLRRPNLD